MNTTNKFFATKEQYITFRTAFASAQNDKRAKKSPPAANGYKAPGWLTASHFMALNLIRRLPWNRGFTEKTSKVYLENGGMANANINDAYRHLTNVVAYAKELMNPKSIQIPSWYTRQADKDKHIAYRTDLAQRNVNKFLEPFAGALSLADLTRLLDQDNKLPEESKKMSIVTETYTIATPQPTTPVAVQLGLFGKIKAIVGL